ncbi:unnamed protein product [Caenorhabditis sp. 36 PRJEB53466]|nr:unnamed protein product [Caenorhabditis sp. 36 PRJEB53466]
MGPTCLNNFLRFANLTAEIQSLQINILAGYAHDHPTMIDMVTRSPQNLGENLVAVLRGFEWTQVGVVLCDECYSDDILASERDFGIVENIFKENNLATKEIVKLKKGAMREIISEEISVFEPIARVILLFLGNNLNDYVEFLSAMALKNYTTDEYTPVIVISKYALGGMALPWLTDSSLTDIFQSTIIVYNNCYEQSKISSFLAKYSFSSLDETLISLQMYEGYHLLGYYLDSAITDTALFNYVQPEKAIAAMNIPGPFGPIFITTTGQRLAGYDVMVVDRNQTTTNGVRQLGTVLADKKCPRLACLNLALNTTYFEPPKDVPLCGFHGEICDQTGVIYAILIVAGGLVIVGIVVTVVKRMIASGKGRSISNPWLIPFTDLKFIDLRNTDGSQHMSIQSLQRNFEERKKMQSLARSSQIATVDQSFVLVDKFVLRDKIKFDKTDTNMLYPMKSHLQHDNLNGFVGLSIDYKSSFIHIIWTQCFRGSLHDHIFTKERQRGTANNFEGAFLRDILKGLEYLHSSTLNYHGNMTLHNCMLDSHWIVKLSGFGVNRLLVKWKSGGLIFTEDHTPIIKSEELHYFDPAIKNLWKSVCSANTNIPAITSKNTKQNVLVTPEMGRKGDMYSFGVILYEIYFKRKFVEPLEDYARGEDDTVLIDEENDKKASNFPLPLVVPEGFEMHNDLVKLLENCFGAPRPDVALARKITDTVLKMSGSLVDLMIKNLTAYTQGLNETRSTARGAAAEQHCKELKTGTRVEAKRYKNVTILYSDIVGFTSLCSESEPMEVVTLLSGMYQRFDLIISQQGGYKMETIGDAYCVAAGLPAEIVTEHVKSISMIALLQRESLHQFEIPHRPGKYLNCRWGFNSGEVFSGVIGQRAPRYACFGEAVTLASKMESNGKEDRIQMTLQSQQLLAEHYPHFITNPRGGVTIDGYGHLLTYWLEGTVEEKMIEYRDELQGEIHKLTQGTNGPDGGGESSSAKPRDKRTVALERAMLDKQQMSEELKKEQTIQEALKDHEEKVEMAEVLVDEQDPRGDADLISVISSPLMDDDDEDGAGVRTIGHGRLDSQASTIPEN